MSHLLTTDMCLKGMSRNRPQLMMDNSKDASGRCLGMPHLCCWPNTGCSGQEQSKIEVSVLLGQECPSLAGNLHILQSFSPVFCPLLWTQM